MLHERLQVDVIGEDRRTDSLQTADTLVVSSKRVESIRAHLTPTAVRMRLRRIDLVQEKSSLEAEVRRQVADR